MSNDGILQRVFFSLKNIKMGVQLLSLVYFHNFDFKYTLFYKSVPNFRTSKQKGTKYLEFLYTLIWSWGQAYLSLNSAKLSLLSEVMLTAAVALVSFDLLAGLPPTTFWYIRSLWEEGKKLRLDRDERRIAFVMQCVALATFFQLTSYLSTYLILEVLVYLLNIHTYF